MTEALGSWYASLTSDTEPVSVAVPAAVDVPQTPSPPPQPSAPKRARDDDPPLPELKRSRDKTEAARGPSPPKPCSLVPSGDLKLRHAFHGEQGPRKTMEDTEIAIQDLQGYCESLVGADDDYSPNNVRGLLRKHAVQFQKLQRGAEGVVLPHMSYYALFDGHCGKRAATFCAKWLHLYCYFELLGAVQSDEAGDPAAPKPSNVKKALTTAFEKLDQAFLEAAREGRFYDGCTALVVLAMGTTIYVASVGDSKAILCRESGDRK
eukprot:Sspe_Gene.94122::Locus_66571_Transcript_1_1_Confidence_1.000_Length_839::g.94122::m.94122/K17500/ILKAP; integrin-linked kinase-associated serine/threonine phosphatase 2C